MNDGRRLTRDKLEAAKMQQQVEIEKARKDIPITKLVPAYFNPEMRTTPNATKQLLDDVKKHGVMAPIHVKPDGDTYLIADGHRRHAVASELGIKQLSCIVWMGSISLAEIWAAVNRPVRPLTAREWFQAWWKYEDPDKFIALMPAKIRGDIRGLLKIYGAKDKLEPFIARNVAPYIVNYIHMTEWLTQRYALKPSPTARAIGYWLIRHNMTAFVKNHYSDKSRPTAARIRKLHRAVLKDTPLTVPELYGTTHSVESEEP